MNIPRMRDAVFSAWVHLRVGAECSADDGVLDEEEAAEVLAVADELLEAYRALTGDNSDPR